MTKVRRPYSRVYWEALDDHKFGDVWHDNARLATWLRLLVAADMAWPASAALYSGVNRAALKVLCDVGLIDMQPAGRYRIHGLDRERMDRSEQGRDAIMTRWHGSTAGLPPEPNSTTQRLGAYPGGNTEGIPSQAEQSSSRAKQSREDARGIPDDARARSNARHMAYLRGDIRTEADLAEARAADAVPVKPA